MSRLRYEDHPEHIHDLIQASLGASDPTRALATHWPTMMAEIESFYVVGMGKASLEMALELQKLCGDRLKGGAVAVVPERLAKLKSPPKGIDLYPAAHPLPDESNLKAAQAIAEVARSVGEKDTLIALISGGGSSHLMLPAGTLTVDDLRQITEALQKAGAPIRALNTVRKHMEQLKGGGLLRLAQPARVWSFILSDVVGDKLTVIASGPTASDPTTYADALEVLGHYGVTDAAPAVTRHLVEGVQGKHPETLKPGDPLLANVRNMLIGSNRLVLEAARKHAAREGWKVVGFQFGVEGEARLEGMGLGWVTRGMLDRPDRPLCYLLGGETSVTVHGTGKGGRSQEFALSAAMNIDGLKDVAIAAFTTDGIDGPTDAAGAIVTGETVEKARALGLDAQEYLNNSDSYDFFNKLDALIRLGPTGTNLNDIAVALVY